jgi:hypothetical protein
VVCRSRDSRDGSIPGHQVAWSGFDSRPMIVATNNTRAGSHPQIVDAGLGHGLGGLDLTRRRPDGVEESLPPFHLLYELTAVSGQHRGSRNEPGVRCAGVVCPGKPGSAQNGVSDHRPLPPADATTDAA